MRLATFDIFDTTLVRRCGEPGVVAHLVAHRLWPKDEMRRTEYLNLRRQAAHGETLAEIYSQSGFGNVPEYTAEEIMDSELTVEAEQLTVNPVMRQKIEQMRSEGWTVKFLSDMYLPSSFLGDVLRREGCLRDSEEVIVSCEWGARKDTGTLYKKVRQKYNPTEWIHFGDNRRSDYKMARKNGVKATLVDFGFTPVERRLQKSGSELREGWRMSLIAGIMRTARVKAALDPAATLAADYVAALYVPYVVWLLRRAKRMGLKRLHFLSRDGYIIMKIAEVLAPGDIELNYLFVSRKALMRAYLSENSSERFIEVADRKSLIGRTVDYFLSQLQLHRKILSDEYGIEFAYNRIVNTQQQEDFLDKLFGNNKLSERLKTLFSDDAKLTLEYLQQEGLADGTAQAMVDIGWLGTSRLMINRILNKNIPTFYVGARGDVYDRSCGDFDTYFAVGQLDTTTTGLIENYYSASPWPSTVGYKKMHDAHLIMHNSNNLSDEIMPRFADANGYEENSVVKANVDTCVAVASALKMYLDSLDDDLLYRFARLSLDSIVNLSDNIDLTSLTKGGYFDGAPMARKLSAIELLNLIVTGHRFTAFDRGSLRLTVGSRIDGTLWGMHTAAARLRARIYSYSLKLRK